MKKMSFWCDEEDEKNGALGCVVCVLNEVEVPSSIPCMGFLLV